MENQITNKAVVNFKVDNIDRSVQSNTAVTNIQGPMEIHKSSLETSYRANEFLIYTIILKNTGTAPLANLTIVDNLGSYKLTSGGTATPLTYVGPASEYINHVYIGQLTPDVNTDSIEFDIANLAGGSTLLLNYKVQVNNAADLEMGSSILNIVSADADGQESPATAEHRLPVASYADVVITKTMKPDPVLDGSTLTYRFLMENYGNQNATSVSLADTFSPLPTNVAATIDGGATSDIDFTGTPVANIFHYPRSTSTPTLTIPAATFTQNPDTGVVTVKPGSHELIVTGII